MLRTYHDTLTTQPALCMVYISQVVLDGDGSERAFLFAFATTNTTDLTSLHGNRTFILVDTGDKDPATLRPLLTQFDDLTRTSLHTSATGGTLVFINLGNARLRIDADGIKLAGCLAVATT